MSYENMRSEVEKLLFKGCLTPTHMDSGDGGINTYNLFGGEPQGFLVGWQRFLSRGFHCQHVPRVEDLIVAGCLLFLLPTQRRERVSQSHNKAFYPLLLGKLGNNS